MGSTASWQSGMVMISSARPGGNSQPSVVMTMVLPLRALISWMLETTLLKISPFGAKKTVGQVLADERDGAVLHLGGGVALGVDVGDLLELERALERDGEEREAAEEEEVLMARVAFGDLLDVRRLLERPCAPGRAPA